MDEALRRLIDSKQKRRQRLAALPWHVKVCAVVRLQRMTAPIARQRGDKRACVWQVPELEKYAAELNF